MLNAFVKKPVRQAYDKLYRELYTEQLDLVIQQEWELLKESGRYLVDVSQEVVLCMWQAESPELKQSVLDERERRYQEEINAYEAFVNGRDGDKLSPEERDQFVVICFIHSYEYLSTAGLQIHSPSRTNSAALCRHRKSCHRGSNDNYCQWFSTR
jgi:hypothetical protein